VGINAVEFAGLDQRGDDGPVFGPGVVPGEESVLPVQGDGTDGALDGIGVDLDAAVGQEAPEAVAVFRNIGQRLAEGRFRGRASAVMAQPVVEAGEDGRRAVLSCGQAGGGIAAPDIGFNGVKLADEGRVFLGDRRGTGDLDQLAAGMGPATGQLDVGTDPVR